MNKPLLIIEAILIPAIVLGLALSVPKEERHRHEPGHETNHVTHAVPGYALAIHGGAGYMTPENTDPERQAAYEAALKAALNVGEVILADGGRAIDAVEQVIRYLEDDSLFNAGKGAVLNAMGRPELDASIMSGSDRMAGAVAGVSTIRNPITAARAVMEKSEHVMLAGRGAEEFARQQGLEEVEPTYFLTTGMVERQRELAARADKHGTVGCVAMDSFGDLAAGTSTGGMMMKKYGRVGDSPIIGAGTYADNSSCAVSCTGHGEYFIRNVIAYDVGGLMSYAGLDLATAADSVILGKLERMGGKGGLIAVDHDGNIHASFNTPGMMRAWVSEGRKPVVKLFAEGVPSAGKDVPEH